MPETLIMRTIWYHATSLENWEKIILEGVLFGVRNAPSRCTYLASEMQEAKEYGNVLLEVYYNPSINPELNNYCEKCWQMRVYEPVEISNVKLLASSVIR